MDTNTEKDKVQKIAETIRTMMEKNFTGYIKVIFTRGNIGRIEKFEEILKEVKRR